MDTIDIYSNGRFIEHESLIADEYGEEVTCTGWIPQLTPVTAAGRAALFNLCANDPDRSSFPYIDLPCVPVKAAAFPKCP